MSHFLMFLQQSGFLHNTRNNKFKFRFCFFTGFKTNFKEIQNLKQSFSFCSAFYLKWLMNVFVTSGSKPFIKIALLYQGEMHTEKYKEMVPVKSSCNVKVLSLHNKIPLFSTSSSHTDYWISPIFVMTNIRTICSTARVQA